MKVSYEAIIRSCRVKRDVIVITKLTRVTGDDAVQMVTLVKWSVEAKRWSMPANGVCHHEGHIIK